MADRNILPLMRWDRRNNRWSVMLWLFAGFCGVGLLLLRNDHRFDPSLSLFLDTENNSENYSKDKTKSSTSKPSHKPSKSPTSSPTETTKQPHLIYLLVDDWGYGNWGYHRPEGFTETITPNLDTLAEEGVVLENFYVHKNCSPTRSSLQTGRFPIHVNVLNVEPTVFNYDDPDNGMSGIPRYMTTIASKLKDVGYSTNIVGKWDAGMASMEHTPKGRGYDNSLVYFHHANGYWSMDAGKCLTGLYQNETKEWIYDLWADDGPASDYTVNSEGCSDTDQDGCVYEDDLFTDKILASIDEHDVDTPFFLVWAPHSVHRPLEVPADILDQFSFIDDNEARQRNAAMVAHLDILVGKVITALKDKGMWDDVVFMVASDNGAPVCDEASNTVAENAISIYDRTGGNNYPLRGGKASAFEGGVRVNAFVGGGFVPESARGSTPVGLSAICDVYTTFCALGGADPFDSVGDANGLPPVDGVDLWSWIVGDTESSPRSEVPIGATLRETLYHKIDEILDDDGTEDVPGMSSFTVVQGLIRDDGWKLLLGGVHNYEWTPEYYPSYDGAFNHSKLNCGAPCAYGENGDPLWSSSTPVTRALCSEQGTYGQHNVTPTPQGCLFNIFDDPMEQNDRSAEYPDIVAELFARIEELQLTVFSPNRGWNNGSACEVAVNVWGGYFGPFVNYSNPVTISPTSKPSHKPSKSPSSSSKPSHKPSKSPTSSPTTDDDDDDDDDDDGDDDDGDDDDGDDDDDDDDGDDDTAAEDIDDDDTVGNDV